MLKWLALKVLAPFRPMFMRAGVDFDKLCNLLIVKLVMDQRRVPTIMRESEGHEEGNHFLRSLGLYLLMGLVMVVFVYIPVQIFLQMNMIYIVTLFIVVTSLLSDFSSVLLDVSEKDILLPKPIDNKTINVAKVLHILIYLLAIIMVLSGPVIVLGTLKHGFIYLAISLVQLVFLAGLSVFVAPLLYFILLRLANTDKLRDVITYVQIGLSVLIMLVWYFSSRAFNLEGLDFSVIATGWWTYLSPPAWFSAPFALFIDNIWQARFVWLTALGVVLPVLLVFVYVRFIAPRFESALINLPHNSETKRPGKLLYSWASIVCSNNTESAFYVFAKKMMAGERNFKLSAYPRLVMGAIVPILLIYNEVRIHESFTLGLEYLRDGSHYLFMYGTLLLFAVVLPWLMASDNRDAAWIYKVLPIGSPAWAKSGAVKALITHVLMPPFLLPATAFTVIYGPRILPDLLVIFLNLTLLLMVSINLLEFKMPFSEKFADVKSDFSARMLLWLLVTTPCILLFAVGHYFLLRNVWIWLYVMLVGVTIKIYWSRIFRPLGE